MNDRKYWLRGPHEMLYIVTLSGHCRNCDAPPGVLIERIDETHVLYRKSRRRDFNCLEMKLAEWPESEGVAIVTGMRQNEFVKAVSRHLVGIQPNGGLFDDKGYIDDDGAEVIAEEMYEDSQRRPKLVVAKTGKAGN